MVNAQELIGFNLFSGLSEQELKGIAPLCQRNGYEANAMIIDPDKPNENLYIVEDENEAVQIEVPIKDHIDKIVVHTLSKGETFGWSSIVSEYIKTTVTRCLRPVTLISINGTSFVQYLEQNPRIGYIVMRNLVGIISSRLTYTTVAFRHEIRISRGKYR